MAQLDELSLVVVAANATIHRAKCIIRPKLWTAQQESQNSGRDDRLLAETMAKHGELELSVDEMQEIIVDDETKRLYCKAIGTDELTAPDQNDPDHRG